jgi:hypothetical protein
MTERDGQTASIGARSLIGRIRRATGGGPAQPGQPAVRIPAKDPFAAYRDVSGPTLVRGPRPRHDAELDADPRVVVLVPHLQLGRMSGGPNTIFHVTAPLVRSGIRLRYVATGGPLEPDETALRAHIRTVTGLDPDPAAVAFVDASAPDAEFAVGRGDVLVATWWPTAHVANAALSITGGPAFVYLIQDFEPGFYAWSTNYALAAATYDLPMRAIVNEPSLADHLRATGSGRFADPAQPSIAFVPAVDRTLFQRSRRRPAEPFRLAFYARPKHARNLFDLGLAVLRTAAARGVFDGSAWEFRAIGSELPELPIDATRTLRAEAWLDYAGYAAFLGETDLLLSLMLSPHTSYPPLEMAASGGHVVTNTFGGKTANALRALGPTIHAAPAALEPLVTALTEGVAAAERADPPASAEAVPASWDVALRDVIPWLLATVAELRGSR